MKKEHIVYIIILSFCGGFFLASCLQISCKNTLYKRVNKFYKKCSQKNCVLNISEIFNFEWDTLFVFPPMTDYRREYQSLQDINRQIAFVKDGRIVYQEDELRVESPYKVTFYNKPFFYTPENAVFTVTQDKHHLIGKYYVLEPINRIITK
ncbi:MAG: hypothetical protein LUE98_14580 [Tannerellaceae bacterium]|nr:hypothetical protein [Tannerellaceae bacterium]